MSRSPAALPASCVVSGAAPSLAPAQRQILSLARAEWGLFLRNKVAILNCLLLPVLCAFFFLAVAPKGASLGVFVPLVVVGTAQLFVVYYTLVTALVARRESLLLKRLRSGECSDLVILAGLCLPFVALALLQAVIALAGAVALFDVAPRIELLVFVVAVLVTTLAFTALAVAGTPMTKSVEHAQITTLPVILVPLICSGLTVPLAVMPDAVRTFAELMPLTPLTQLTTIGLGGVDVDGAPVTGAAAFTAAVRPMLVMLAWIAFSGWMARRTMRWEPRS